jgi:hypothetical protein
VSIGTYSELQTAVAGWLHRSDMTARIPEFIALAESKINRRLRVPGMEATLSATTITDGVIPLPDAFASVKTLWIEGFEREPLKAQTLEYITARASLWIAKHYTRQGASLRFDGVGDVAGVYYERVPTLSDAAPENWLLSESPDLYLFGALGEAALHIKDEQRGALWQQRFEVLIDELNAAAVRDAYAGPLVARSR